MTVLMPITKMLMTIQRNFTTKHYSTSI